MMPAFYSANVNWDWIDDLFEELPIVYSFLQFVPIVDLSSAYKYQNQKFYSTQKNKHFHKHLAGLEIWMSLRFGNPKSLPCLSLWLFESAVPCSPCWSPISAAAAAAAARSIWTSTPPRRAWLCRRVSRMAKLPLVQKWNSGDASQFRWIWNVGIQFRNSTTEPSRQPFSAADAESKGEDWTDPPSRSPTERMKTTNRHSRRRIVTETTTTSTPMAMTGIPMKMTIWDGAGDWKRRWDSRRPGGSRGSPEGRRGKCGENHREHNLELQPMTDLYLLETHRRWKEYTWFSSIRKRCPVTILLLLHKLYPLCPRRNPPWQVELRCRPGRNTKETVYLFTPYLFIVSFFRVFIYC